MRYDDFVLSLGPRTSRGLEVKAASSISGEGRGLAELSLPPEALAARFRALVGLDDSVRNLEPLEAGSAVRALSSQVRELGATIFDSVFRGRVRNLLDHSLGRVEGDPDRGLRIKLTLDLGSGDEARLHSVPWEALYKSDTGDFLGLSRRTPIVRHLEVARPTPSTPVPDILRILALAPEPPEQRALDLGAERTDLQALEASVSGLEVSFPEAPTLWGLRRALLEREFQVLHLMGHGDFDCATGEGVVYLESEGGRGEAISAESLVAVIKDFPSLRLVVLNACNTGRAGSGGRRDPFSGVAPALTRAGIGAVLAMQLPISDRAAITFSKAFYGRLAAGDPLGGAVAEGRQAIRATLTGSFEWAVPALFSRVDDQPIVCWGAGRAPRGDATSAGLTLLQARDFEGAIRELRAEAVGHPDRGRPKVALGVAMARGQPLHELSFRTATEMHRLFESALSTSDGRRSAAAALLALKLAYFEENAVREPAPSREEVTSMLADPAPGGDDEWLPGCLAIPDEVREILVRTSSNERSRS